MPLATYCNVALQIEHCFGNNIKSKMRILDLIGKINFNQKNPNQKYF